MLALLTLHAALALTPSRGGGGGSDATTVAGVTPGTGGLAILDDASISAIRTTLQLTDPLYAPQVYTTTSDWTNSTTTLTDLTGVSFTPVADATYLIEGYWAFEADASTTGLQVWIDSDNASKGALWCLGRGTSSTSAVSYYGVSTTGPTAGGTSATVAGTWSPWYCWTEIHAAAAAPGAVTLQAASEVAGSTVTVRAGVGTMRVTRTR